jgi:ATP-binding cassette, subfamily B, bacterial
LFDPLSGAAELYSRAQKAFASVWQVQRVFEVRPKVLDRPEQCLTLPRVGAEIEFVEVEFGYERHKRMLRVPSLSILPGEKLAISGENGAGKSTLTKLIARLYDVDGGAVRIGGQDIRSFELNSLRRYVCYLSREPALFDSRLVSNLRFVNAAASDEEIRGVVESAGLGQLASNLQRALQQRIGPGACQLSGGERERLAIARALLQRPQILILDEATSSLDPSSEELVLRNVFCNLNGSTIIVISHRLSTLSSFGRNIVMAAGQIVADGSPRHLLSAVSRSEYPAQRSASTD